MGKVSWGGDWAARAAVVAVVVRCGPLIWGR